jgi:hypothetical protein
MTRDGPPAWKLGEALTTHYHKSQVVIKCYTGLQTWWDLENMVMNLQVP